MRDRAWRAQVRFEEPSSDDTTFWFSSMRRIFIFEREEAHSASSSNSLKRYPSNSGFPCRRRLPRRYP